MNIQHNEEKLFIYDANQEEIDQIEVPSVDSCLYNGSKLEFDTAYIFQIGHTKTILTLTSAFYRHFIRTFASSNLMFRENHLQYLKKKKKSYVWGRYCPINNCNKSQTIPFYA